MTLTPHSTLAVDTPYKGLIPYSEGDAQFFFGRDEERDLAIANLMASRLTLLFGESGEEPVGLGSCSGLSHGVSR